MGGVSGSNELYQNVLLVFLGIDFVWSMILLFVVCF